MHLGTITLDDQIKFGKRADREANLEGGFKAVHKTHKDKKREDSRNSCRNFKF